MAAKHPEYNAVPAHHDRTNEFSTPTLRQGNSSSSAHSERFYTATRTRRPETFRCNPDNHFKGTSERATEDIIAATSFLMTGNKIHPGGQPDRIRGAPPFFRASP